MKTYTGSKVKFTRYFENEILKKRPELRLDWIEETILHPEKRKSNRMEELDTGNSLRNLDVI